MTEWISVKDRLPKTWGMYLLYYCRNYSSGSKSLEMQVIHFDNQRNKFNVEYTDDEPKYWMSLPSAPSD